VVKKEYSYTSTPPMGHAACTEPQCLYKDELYPFFTQSQEEKEYPTYSKKRKANLIGHIWRRNGFLKHVTEGKIDGRIEVTGRRRRRRYLLVYLQEARGRTRWRPFLWQKLWLKERKN